MWKHHLRHESRKRIRKHKNANLDRLRSQSYIESETACVEMHIPQTKSKAFICGFEGSNVAPREEDVSWAKKSKRLPRIVAFVTEHGQNGMDLS